MDGRDPYEGMGEFHDLFMDDAWARLRPVLTEAFAHLDESATVLDLGAGTGLGTRALAASTPARIVAVEPPLTMRAVLTARRSASSSSSGSARVGARRSPSTTSAHVCRPGR
jgi:methylase of polypeptide subunit release factors